EIQVIANPLGVANQIAANLNIPSGTQIVRIGGNLTNDNDLVFNNVISGAGGFFKTDSVDGAGLGHEGIIYLLGNNTYTGSTTLSGGQNFVTGTNASTALTISAGRTTLFGAAGSYSAAATVNIG